MKKLLRWMPPLCGRAETCRWLSRSGVIFRAIAVCLGFGGASALSGAAVNSPIAADAARPLFQVDPGLRVELVAAEPLVQAPCAVAWDERGRLFVAENRGYPTGSRDGRPVGIVAMLEDTDQDGRMDKRTDFAVGLTFPNGLLPWNGGLIVTCAPDVLFLKDADGDGRAEVREVWLTGFDSSKTTQLRVSHPILGPDGWIYLTSGWAGTSFVSSPQHPDRSPVELASDCRFNPATLEVEAVDGRAQFGQSFDDWGNRFICFNRVHIQHVVLSSRLLQRNPHLAFSETVQDVPGQMVSDLINGANQNPAARIYPISHNITTADSHAGQFSAACAVTIYLGDGLPAAYYGDAFACDPTGNLVHRDRLTPAGPTFSSSMANEGREFLASPDDWFRPVYLAVGPEGGLYVCDMYRRTIEHPEYLPEEVRKRTDFTRGKDMGRIWRVLAGSSSRKSPAPGEGPAQSDLGLRPTAELVELLGHSNVWQRETARRLLLQRKSPDTLSHLAGVFPAVGRFDLSKLRRAATNPPGPGPHLARAHALNIFYALAGGRIWLTEDPKVGFSLVELFRANDRKAVEALYWQLVLATFDEVPGVRTTAFRILTAFPGEGPDLADEMHRAWASDPNGQARFHAALFLSKCAYGDTFGALARIARQDGTNRWTRAAVISGLKGRENYFFETVMRQTNSALPPELMRDLCRLDVNPSEAVLALTDPDAAERLFGVRQIKGEGAASWQLAGLAGLCETLRAPPGSSHAAPKLADFVDRVFGEPAIWKTDGRFLASLLARAEFLLADEAQPLVVRESALKVLLHERGAAIAPALLQRFRPNEDPAVQQAAARALVNLPEENFVRDLLAPDRWNVLSPNVRATLLGLLLSQPRHTETLLELMEQGRVLSSQIGRAQRDRLLNHKNGTIQARARKLFTEVGGDRMKAYQGQKAVLQLTGDASHGREVFQTHCATCHRLSGQGYSVGPDIFGMRSQSKETILLHVIVPNYEINPGFVAYEIQTADDRSLTGLIASETATSLTIRQAQGLEETLRRSEIRSIQASAVSLMPEELEKTMSQRDLADLLAFLKGE